MTGLEQTNSKVTVHFSAQESEAFDLCIGADGIHSNVREAVGASTKLIYQGYTCFRGIVDDVNLKDEHVANEYWGAKGRVGVVPLLNNQAYWFITVPAKERDPNIKHLVNRIYKHILIIFQMKYDKYLISKVRRAYY